MTPEGSHEEHRYSQHRRAERESATNTVRANERSRTDSPRVAPDHTHIGMHRPKQPKSSDLPARRAVAKPPTQPITATKEQPYRAFIANPVRRALTARIGAFIIALTFASATPGHAQTPQNEITPVQCPQFCIAVYVPVTCMMSDRTVRRFSNRCWANVYACEHRLTIISCQPALQ
jgi:hypothetical protein